MLLPDLSAISMYQLQLCTTEDLVLLYLALCEVHILGVLLGSSRCCKSAYVLRIDTLLWSA